MTDTLELGKVLNNRYRIISVLGRGGMSNVYLVEDERLKSRWALKEMLDIFPDEHKTDILERFHREAQILAGMKHPNLPRVFDCFQEEGRNYLVMEYIEGLTLEEILEKNKSLDPGKVVNWAVQVCDVLQTLHDQGIIYRDMKPSNVMVGIDNRVSIIDFGIARLFSGNKIHDTIIIGTPGFASPEHHGTSETDARSDIFSLGATLHHLLTGRDPGLMPFVFEDPRKINPAISPELSAVIMKALALNPADRFQTAEQFRKALKQISSKDTPASPAPAIGGPVTSASAPVNDTSQEDSGERAGEVTALPVSHYGGIPFNRREEFPMDFISAYTYPGVMSGGVSMMAAYLLGLTGLVSSPVMLMGLALGIWIPGAYGIRKMAEYIFRLPRIHITLSPDGITFKNPSRQVSVSWDEVTGFLIFTEKSRIGIPLVKYRVFTKKGDFEFSGDQSRARQLSDLVITHGGLGLSGESGSYRRYSR